MQSMNFMLFGKGIAPHSNVLSRSNDVQQNPLPQYRNNQEQLTQPTNIQVPLNYSSAYVFPCELNVVF